MKKAKKLSVVALAMAMLFSATSCAKNQESLSTNSVFQSDPQTEVQVENNVENESDNVVSSENENLSMENGDSPSENTGASVPANVANSTATAQTSFKEVSPAYFEVVGKDRATVDHAGKMTFTNITKDKEVSFAYNAKLTGEYAIEFKMGETATTNKRPCLWFALGGEDYSYDATTSVGMGIKSDSVVNGDNTAWYLNPNNRNGWMTKSYFRIVVLSDGDIDIYQEHEAIDTSKHTPRGHVDLNNADFSLTDGFATIANGLNGASDTLDTGFMISDFKVISTALGTTANELTAFDVVRGDASKLTQEQYAVTKDIKTDASAKQPMFKSKFKISDEGVAEGEKVFEMTYTVNRYHDNGAGSKIRWGLFFGLDKDTIELTGNETQVAQQHATFYYGNTSEATTSYMAKGYKTFTVTGYKGGKLTVNATTYGKVYETTGVDFNGYIAFGTLGGQTLNSGATDTTNPFFRVDDLSFTGNIAVDVAENTLKMEDCSIRTTVEDSGLRFTASVAATSLSKVIAMADSVEYGILYHHTTELGDNGLTLDNYQALNGRCEKFTSSNYIKNGRKQFSFVFVNIPEADYTRARSVRFFAKVTVDGNAFVYYSETLSTSIDDVATTLYNLRSDVETLYYKYLTKDGNYSPYDEGQLNCIKKYIVEG